MPKKNSNSFDEKQIGKNIRRTRRKQKISLEQLGKLAGLTKGYISKIENSDKAPPFSTLSKIAHALDADIALLMLGESDMPKDLGPSILKKEERKTIISKDPQFGYNYAALAPKRFGKRMEPCIIEPAFDEKTFFRHPGEEFLYVLQGRHEFNCAGEKYILEEGDSVYFDSKISHRIKSLPKGKGKILVVYTYER